jgi:uncharacterized membrane protein
VVVWSLVVLVAIAWVYLGFAGGSLVHTILAVPLVLIVPGALLVLMLPSRPADLSFQIGLAIGLSIAICIMAGLLLNTLPEGIDQRTWACALGLLSVSEAVVVATRRTRTGAPRSGSFGSASGMGGPRRAIIATFAVVTVVASVAAIVAWERSNAEAANSQERFSELWIQTSPGGPAMVNVRSDISGTERFRLSVTAAGEPSPTFTFELKSQQTWTHEISVAHDAKERVLISLFSGSSSQPSARLWYQPS